MGEMKHIAEVRNDYREDDSGKYMIDVYLTGDDDEEGFTAASDDPDGVVEWIRMKRLHGYDMTPVHEAIEEAKNKQLEIKQELVDKCIEEIKRDVASGDVTAIDGLLIVVPTKALQDYLPEKTD